MRDYYDLEIKPKIHYLVFSNYQEQYHRTLDWMAFAHNDWWQRRDRSAGGQEKPQA
jgi:hypothetical protein